MSDNSGDELKARWYHGGLAGAMAACCTHPLDLIKVHLQTVSSGERLTMFGMSKHIVRTSGVSALYNGLSAAILRQLTYSMTRFAIYEGVKNHLPYHEMPFYQKILLGGFAGLVGGVVGTPADLINVRMQNDVKLAQEKRRNYKHALHGLAQVYRHEGPAQLMSGVTMASARAVVITIGQLSMYDTYKELLMHTGMFGDTLWTHFDASFLAGATATFITMPMDVLKTRMMNARQGHYSGIGHCVRDVASLGPAAFFKGFVPAFVRLGPHTVLMFIFFEQLRHRFGYKDT